MIDENYLGPDSHMLLFALVGKMNSDQFGMTNVNVEAIKKRWS
jgi:hypothetical protein